MNRLRWLLLIGLTLTLLGAYVALRSLRDGPAPALPPSGRLPSATLINDEQPLAPFSLAGAGGKLSNADLKGHWTFLFFGYTYCPDICPTSLTVMAQVKQELIRQGVAAPEVLFVSVDPKRDTPEQLGTFTRYFDASFRGATGNDAEIAAVVKHLGVYYQRHDKGDGKPYAVDHTGAIYLVDPPGRLKAVFSYPHDPKLVAADYLTITR